MFLLASDSLLKSWKAQHEKIRLQQQEENNDNDETNNGTDGIMKQIEMIDMGGNIENSYNDGPRERQNSKLDNDNIEAEPFLHHPSSQDDDDDDDSKFGITRNNKSQLTNKKVAVVLSYPELALAAFGPTCEAAVKLGIALMQSGVCLTYLIFVPHNLHASFLQFFGWQISPAVWLAVMILWEIPLSWIRDIRKFKPTNLVANVFILYGLVTCLGFALEEAAFKGSEVPLVELRNHLTALSPIHSQWFLFIGTSVLLFEGSITLLIPLQEAVQTEEQRNQFPLVYRKVILCIILFYVFFGLTCWMAFGDNVNTVLTTSLPESNLATTVQLAYSLAVIFTFPLQNFPALEIATRTIATLSNNRGNGYDSSSRWWARRNVISSALVVVLAFVAALAMESLDKVVSLMGSLLGCPIAFIFPPLIHNRLLKSNLLRTRRNVNYAVASLGVIAMVMASATTILAWNE